MLQEFKDFALKGNVLDLAIGVIMGVAFGKIITSLVEDVLMPIIGMIFGSPDFSALHLGAIKIGNFINSAVSFFFIAVALFVFVKAINSAMKAASKKQAEAPAAAPVPTTTELLLGEIRDSLARR